MFMLYVTLMHWVFTLLHWVLIEGKTSSKPNWIGIVLVRDMNSLAMEEVGLNSDLWPNQNDVHFIVVKKCEPIGNSSQSRDLTILSCDQILGQFKMFVIADSTWVSILGFVAFEITYTLPWVEIKTQFPAITGGISNNSKFYNLETPRIYNYNALVVSDSNEIQSASSKSRFSKQ